MVVQLYKTPQLASSYCSPFWFICCRDPAEEYSRQHCSSIRKHHLTGSRFSHCVLLIRTQSLLCAVSMVWGWWSCVSPLRFD